MAKPSTKRYRGYAQQLADERDGGFVDPGTISHLRYLAAGKSIESQAVGRYELEYDTEVQYFGADNPTFILSDMDCFGCSPDCLVGDDGGVEIKCAFARHIHIKRMSKGMEPGHLPQIRGQLLATRREWFDFFSYCPTYSYVYVERIYRDEKVLTELREKIIAYDKYVESLREGDE